MPGKDGTGPQGTGPKTGRRGGRGNAESIASAGSGASARGDASAKGGAGRGRGAVGDCICPQCGAITPHSAGIPCSQTKCPNCGFSMARK